MPQFLEVYSTLDHSVSGLIPLTGAEPEAPSLHKTLQLGMFATQEQADYDSMSYMEKTIDAKVPIVNTPVAMEREKYESRSPSPLSSGTVTPPTPRLPLCPARLRPLLPPINYGTAETGAIYRSAYPQDCNIDFLRCLDIATVLCLVDTEPSVAYARWISHNGIKRRHVEIKPNKHGKVNTTWDSICEALLIVMDAENYPLYIHCNQGRHRTGCVIACLRKAQRWDINDILEEYHSYSDPKARSSDIDFIRTFDPEAVFEYAKSHRYLENQSFIRRTNSTIVNIDGLAQVLGGKASLLCDDSESSIASNASTISDDLLEMKFSSPMEVLECQRPVLHQIEVDQNHSSSSIDFVRATPLRSTNTGRVLDLPVDIVQPEASVTELLDDIMSPPLE